MGLNTMDINWHSWFCPLKNDKIISSTLYITWLFCWTRNNTRGMNLSNRSFVILLYKRRGKVCKGLIGRHNPGFLKIKSQKQHTRQGMIGDSTAY